MRRKFLIGCLGFLAVLLIGVMIAVYVADGKFEIFRAPRTTYSDALGLEWPVRVLIEPAFISENLVDRIKASAPDLPEWLSSPGIIEQILPQEIAILLAPAAARSDLDVAWFVNENRFGPNLKPVLAQLPVSVPGITWEPEGLQHPKRGTFFIEGEMPVDRLATDYFDEQWNRLDYQAPLETTGGHFIEVLLDNRTGMAFLLTTMGLAANQPEVLRSTPANVELPPDQKMAQAQMKFLISSLKKIDSLHLVADPAADDTLAMHLDVACDPDAGRGGPETAKTVLDTGLAQLQELLRAQYGITLEGKTQIQGTNLEGEYTARPLSTIMGLFIQ